MSVRAFSAMTYYAALAWQQLGRKGKAKKLLADLLAYAEELERAEAKIDYFATSLPTMLLFDDELAFRQATTARFLQAQARLGLGQKARACRLLKSVLQRDPHHALAADLLAATGRKSRPARRSPPEKKMVAAAGGIDGPFAGGQIALIGKKGSEIVRACLAGAATRSVPPCLQFALPLQ